MLASVNMKSGYVNVSFRLVRYIFSESRQLQALRVASQGSVKLLGSGQSVTQCQIYLHGNVSLK